MFGRIAVLVVCLVAVVSPDGGLHLSSPVAPAQVAQTRGGLPPATPTTSPVYVANPTPSRLLIPRIGVNATIEARALDSGRNLLTPRDFHDVAWYSLGPMPGTAGNALMNGHVDWWTGSAVFTRLSELRAGDLVIVVRGDGTRVRFKVTGQSTVAAGARVASLFAPSRVATLTLITCTGPWDPLLLGTAHRLLVSAVLA